MRRSAQLDGGGASVASSFATALLDRAVGNGADVLLDRRNDASNFSLPTFDSALPLWMYMAADTTKANS